MTKKTTTRRGLLKGLAGGLAAAAVMKPSGSGAALEDSPKESAGRYPDSLISSVHISSRKIADMSIPSTKRVGNGMVKSSLRIS